MCPLSVVFVIFSAVFKKTASKSEPLFCGGNFPPLKSRCPVCTNLPYSMAAVVRVKRRHRPLFSEGVDVFHDRMLHVLVTRNVFGALAIYDHWPMPFCKALSWKSLWIKASAKWINAHVNVLHCNMFRFAVTSCTLLNLSLRFLFPPLTRTITPVWFLLAGPRSVRSHLCDFERVFRTSNFVKKRHNRELNTGLRVYYEHKTPFTVYFEKVYLY